MMKSNLIIKQIIIGATFFAYLTFVSLKFNSINIFTFNLFDDTVDLVDWNDDRFYQDKEFSAENVVFKASIVNISPFKKGNELKTNFFYNKIYKEIKLSIITPPPKIG